MLQQSFRGVMIEAVNEAGPYKLRWVWWLELNVAACQALSSVVDGRPRFAVPWMSRWPCVRARFMSILLVCHLFGRLACLSLSCICSVCQRRAFPFPQPQPLLHAPEVLFASFEYWTDTTRKSVSVRVSVSLCGIEGSREPLRQWGSRLGTLGDAPSKADR